MTRLDQFPSNPIISMISTSVPSYLQFQLPILELRFHLRYLLDDADYESIVIMITNWAEIDSISFIF